MIPPLEDITPEVNSEWLALRQKHREDTDEFQRAITRRRAEFESRIDLSRKKLLQQYIGEEAEFWGAHGRGPCVAKSATSPWNIARSKTSITVQANATALENTPTPAPLHLIPKKTQQAPPATPRKAPQPAKATKVPPAPTKAQPRASQKQVVREVIDLCDSDDDDLSIAKKMPVIRKPIAQSPTHQRSMIDEVDQQDSDTSETASKSIRPTIPQATLELFGDKMTKHLVKLLFHGQRPRANPNSRVSCHQMPRMRYVSMGARTFMILSYPRLHHL
jgi:hypothetical protein